MGVTAALASLLLLCGFARPLPAVIVVAYESSVPAYVEALDGVATSLGEGGLRLADLSTTPALGPIAAGDVQLVIAIGRRAVTEVQARKLPVPVIAAMVLHGESEGAPYVELDVPLATQLQAIRALWPNRSRAGILLGPSGSRYSMEVLEARLRREGFTAVIVACPGPAGLLKALSSLKGKVDFLLCLPDPAIYNSVTIKPLVLASLENRMPIVGFSPGLVRAGAAAGIYPDYREIGRQAGDMARRALRGEECSEEAPRKVQIAVNQRVLRLLGLDLKSPSLPLEVFR